MLSNLVKWRLIARTAPYAGAVLVLKLVLTYGFNFQGLIAIGEIRIILTSGIFLTGFMLAGTLADYKESERIPGRIAALLEALEEISITLARQAKLDVVDIQKKILTLGHAVHDWFYKKVDDNTLHDHITEYNETLRALLKGGGAPPIVGRVHQYLFDLRAILTRTHVISRTGFLATGYALLELILVAITILLLLTDFNTVISTAFNVFFVELLYIYMYKLIWDIDDPFEYEATDAPETGETVVHAVGAEVPIFPVTDYLERLQARIQASPEAPADAT